MSIKENCEIIEQGIIESAAKAGRKRGEITLVAVTKFVEWARISEALDAGITDAGENRVQELVGKLPDFHGRGTNVHLIGQLQKNKVKYIIGNVKLIQSVDRLELAEEISRLAVKNNTVQNTLIEVNIGSEEQKGGVLTKDLPQLLEKISVLPGIAVKGLMCVPPAVGEEQARPYFAHMRSLFDSMRPVGDNIAMETLSMGMSGDYRAAIAEGSTMVRIGSAIFGARPKPPVGKA